MEDLRLLENMASTKEIDYIEIDRILNGMFTPVKKSSSKFQESDGFLKTYQVIKLIQLP